MAYIPFFAYCDARYRVNNRPIKKKFNEIGKVSCFVCGATNHTLYRKSGTFNGKVKYACDECIRKKRVKI